MRFGRAQKIILVNLKNVDKYFDFFFENPNPPPLPPKKMSVKQSEHKQLPVLKLGAILLYRWFNYIFSAEHPNAESE